MRICSGSKFEWKYWSEEKTVIRFHWTGRVHLNRGEDAQKEVFRYVAAMLMSAGKMESKINAIEREQVFFFLPDDLHLNPSATVMSFDWKNESQGGWYRNAEELKHPEGASEKKEWDANQNLFTLKGQCFSALTHWTCALIMVRYQSSGVMLWEPAVKPVWPCSGQ